VPLNADAHGAFLIFGGAIIVFSDDRNFTGKAAIGS
jgi:hypothetical protein